MTPSQPKKLDSISQELDRQSLAKVEDAIKGIDPLKPNAVKEIAEVAVRSWVDHQQEEIEFLRGVLEEIGIDCKNEELEDPVFFEAHASDIRHLPKLAEYLRQRKEAKAL
jgi:hypothetical protein